MPNPTSCHAKSTPFIDKCLNATRAVFVRMNAVRKPLQPPYEGPFIVIERFAKYLKINMNAKHDNVSFQFRIRATEQNTSNNKREINKTNNEIKTSIFFQVFRLFCCFWKLIDFFHLFRVYWFFFELFNFFCIPFSHFFDFFQCYSILIFTIIF